MRAFSTWSAIAFAAIATSLFTGCDDDEKAVAPSITAPASPLGNGVVGTAITPVDIVTSGTAPITYAVSAGILPPGLALETSTGRLTGTPTLAGIFEFTITATNRAGTDDASYMQSVLQRPAITTPPSPLATTTGGVASPPVTFEASGSMPITWSITAGALPPGMALNATTGAYSGTPTAAGDYSFTVTATNAAGSDSDAYTQQITAPAANAHVLINGNSIAAVATTFPSGLETPLPLTGLNTGETLVSIDRRPQNGFLYGLGYNAAAGTVQLYSISTTTGIAAPLGATGTFIASDGMTPVPVGAGAGTTFGMDFNPTVDRVRVVNSAGQNFRMNPNNGAFVDGTAGGVLEHGWRHQRPHERCAGDGVHQQCRQQHGDDAVHAGPHYRCALHTEPAERRHADAVPGIEQSRGCGAGVRHRARHQRDDGEHTRQWIRRRGAQARGAAERNSGERESGYWRCHALSDLSAPVESRDSPCNNPRSRDSSGSPPTARSSCDSRVPRQLRR